MALTQYGFRKRLLARVMAKGGPRYERMVAGRKQALFAEVRGDVLEIGAGTGPNLRYLHRAKHYIASEPNPFMHPYLQAEIARQGIPGEIDSRPAEALLSQTPEGSFDTVVSTLVLCSVKDPQAMLTAVRRVLRPGGKLLLLEHIGATSGSALCACQFALSPIFQFLGDGCHPTRRTAELLVATGFTRMEVEHFHLPLGPIAPHICGWAEK